MKMVRTILLIGVVLTLLGIGFIYSGLYPVSADTPHSDITYKVLETLREKSISRASKDITVPPLDNPDLLLSGGPDYNEMCVSCHLKPNLDETDLSMGLYPAPPNLSIKHTDEDDGHSHEESTPEEIARRQFWIIKHGIKASGMPAWGITHDDNRIWAMVAFLQKLPELTPQQYQVLTARGEDMDSHH